MDFEYEVLIGEDCSTDSSATILREMQKDLPEYFHIFYREKNMGMGQKGNASDLGNRALGEYIITVEGDDYWIYDKKLQEQVDFLDSHSEYVAVAHNCQVVDEDSNIIDVKYPECKENEYTFKHYLKWLLPGQLATVMYRKSYYPISEKFYNEFKLYDTFAGDRLKAFLMLTEGKFFCIQKKWSAYRFVTSHGSSFSANYKRDKKLFENEELFYKSIKNYSKYIQNEEAERVSAKLRYSFILEHCFGKEKAFNISYYFQELSSENKKTYLVIYSLKKLLMKILYDIKYVLKKLVKAV